MLLANLCMLLRKDTLRPSTKFGMSLFFKKKEHRMIEVYTNVDWTSSYVDKKSTSRYYTYVWGNLVTWRSKRQLVVARSSAKAKFRALAHGIYERI